MDIFQEAIERVREADASAFASQLAFAIGPDKFREHIDRSVEAIRKRIEDEYAGHSNNGIAESINESESKATG